MSARLPLGASPSERLAFRTVVDPSGCWLWTGAGDKWGYGRTRIDGRLWASHRLSYTVHVGPIPEGLEIDHLCRVPACINPAHLEPVTPRTDTLRSNSVTSQHAHKTHCAHGHLFDEFNTYYNRRGYRNCRTCWADRARAQRRKRSAVKDLGIAGPKVADLLPVGRETV